MRITPRLPAAWAALFLLWGMPAGAADKPGDFSFYVLSLSWSPSYCEAEGSGADPQQCRASRPLAFAVHGLWPQREQGFPESCAAGERDVPRGLMRSLYDLMPSTGLIRHEWRKHGTCSGLSQADYFGLLRKARERIAVPAQFRSIDRRRVVDPRAVERAFVSANPGLTVDAIAVTCDNRLLREVRICLTKDLAFRPCPAVDRRACRRASVAMPAMR